MWLRVKSPAAALPRILKIAKDPWLRGFADIRAIAGLLLGDELTGLIDFEAPMDALMRRRSEDSGMVVAVHLVNDAGFRPDKLGLGLLPVSPGRWQIRPSHYTGTLRCELWHAPAPIGYRILCGDAADELARAAPFLLGRLARQPLTSDARVVSSDYPLADRFRDRTGEPQEINSDETSAQDDPAQRLVASLAKAENIAFDLNFLEQDIELGVELSFLAADISAAFRSWLGAPQPLPLQFWQVLDFAPITVAFTGTDEQTTQRLLGDEAGWLRSFLVHFNGEAGISPALGERMLRAMGGFIPERLRFTVSSGGSSSLVRPASNNAARAATPLTGARWLLLGLAGAGNRYQAGLDVLFDASQAKSAKDASGGASSNPNFVRIPERPAGLPAESVLFRMGSGKDPCFGWVLPTADWIWLLTSPSEQQVIAEARRLLPSLGQAPAPDEAAQAGLGGRPPLVAMSFNLAGLEAAFGEEAVHLDAEALPFGGSARIFVRLSGGKQQGEQGERFALQLWSRWSPAAVADAVELIRPHIERSLEP